MAAEPPQSSQTPFHDLDAFVALPRTSGLALSVAGDRLVTSVATLNPDRTKYVTAVWEVDPTGERPARRLTRSARGEGAAAFLPNGDVLFISARPDPEGKDDEDEVPMLWLLPASGGEAYVVAKRPGGIGAVLVARESRTIVVSSATLPTSADSDDDEAKRKERKDRKVSAVLHERYPVRFWDHDLGPDAPRLLVGSLSADAKVELRDLTPDAGHALIEADFDVSDDGRMVVTSWNVPDAGALRPGLAVVDVASGERRMLVEDEEFEYGGPAISPDGGRVAALRESRTTPTEPPDISLVVVSLADGSVHELAADWDRWPSAPIWTPDGSALIVTADDHGRAPVFRVDVATGAVTKLTRDDCAYTDPVIAPDGRHVYALRTSYLAPPAPVRLDAAAAEQVPEPLPAPASPPELPGTLSELSTETGDGATVRAWLALPEGAGPQRPAPLLLWVHGGPMSSWNTWQWRWNPWLMVARGYAVLLPDPALSTGYGREFIRRGWGRWGEAPFTDLMAVADAAVARDDVDGDRSAAMGGSFGGYMTNWIAGHTERFDAIVTHASLWALESFWSTTDAAWYWQRELTAEMTAANSPHHHADAIATPMLVIHGDKDYRVPVGEALRLWYDLADRSKSGDGEMPHKFLYFPDENHWVLTPEHVKIWYGTVLAFLAHHVMGEPWEPPALLR